MKNGRMQAKDVADEPVLRFIHHVRSEGVVDCRPPHFDDWRYRNVTWFQYDDGYVPPNSVRHAMPSGTPDKVVLAKMKALIRRGLVDGCDCGCRGDFELTDKGRSAIGAPPAETPSIAVVAGSIDLLSDVSVDAGFESWMDGFQRQLARALDLSGARTRGSIGSVPSGGEVEAALRAAGITVSVVGCDIAEERIEIELPSRFGLIEGPFDVESLLPLKRSAPIDRGYLAHDPTKTFRRARPSRPRGRR